MLQCSIKLEKEASAMESKTAKYENYIGLDWAQSNMAAAVISEGSVKAKVLEGRPDIMRLKKFIKSFKGTKRLVVEETTSTQWLFGALVGSVDELIVCDPYKNKMMGYGPKNDRIDSIKLAELATRTDINAVYHSTSDIMQLRRIISGYEDIVKSIVRAKNQQSAIYRGECKRYKSKEKLYWNEDVFVSSLKGKEIEFLEIQKMEYEKAFRVYARKSAVRNLMTIPGIGLIGAVKTLGCVVDARRFKSKSKFYGYCGLAKHLLISGGRCYGKKNTRYNRVMKCVMKTAAMAAISGDNGLSRYYKELVSNGYPEYTARNVIARRIAVMTLGVMKSGTKYQEKQIAA
jgi:transposase